MYKLGDIREIHLETTSRCQASCPMCPRNIQGGIENPWLVEDEITIDQFKSWFPESFIQQLDRVYMCGNLGDAVVAKDTLEIFSYLRITNTRMALSLHTNGSARSSKWWTDLAKLNVDVTFGIDGLEDTHSLYRIGTNWNKIIDNATAFINAGGHANWHMLVFEHNKHQIDECKQLSETLGFKSFTIKNSSRFRDGFMQVLNKDGTTSHIIYPSDRSKEISQTLQTLDLTNKEINCKVKGSKSIYVGANGNLTPCCWLDFTGIIPTSFSLVDYKDKGFITPNLKLNTLEEIFESGYFDKVEESWSCSPLRQCNKQCGKVDKLNEQFK